MDWKDSGKDLGLLEDDGLSQDWRKKGKEGETCLSSSAKMSFEGLWDELTFVEQVVDVCLRPSRSLGYTRALHEQRNERRSQRDIGRVCCRLEGGKVNVSSFLQVLPPSSPSLRTPWSRFSDRNTHLVDRNLSRSRMEGDEGLDNACFGSERRRKGSREDGCESDRAHC